LTGILHSVPFVDLLEIRRECCELARAFDAQQRSLYLVGGIVRDLVVQADLPPASVDIDLTTDATPDEIESIVRPVADSLWTVGKKFGTIGIEIQGRRIEITTHRADSYVHESRKPEVKFSRSIVEDLSRRDFTINAMAIDLIDADRSLIDPFGGLNDLAHAVLRTPINPEVSMSEDPLRMLRAARFLARFSLEIDAELLEAIQVVGARLSVVSPERIRDELCKLLRVDDPSAGLWYLVKTGLFDHFLPEIPALALEQDPIHHHKDVLAHTIEVVRRSSPTLTLRLAALLHDIGKPRTRQVGPDGVSFHFHDVVGAKMARKRLTALHFATNEIDPVVKLVELHLRFHTYGAGWNDRAVRRYVRDAGELLEELNELTLCDATTRNQQRVQLFRARMSELEERISALREQEELDSIRPELNGEEVMELLSLQPSRAVGQALDFLLEIRLDEGLLGRDEVVRRLVEWWSSREAS
jgi:poly(A) polymerase